MSRVSPETRRVLCLFVVILAPGCAPATLLQPPPGVPQEIQGRKLYYTPRGFLYATNAPAAGWADRYLKERLGRIPRQFEVSLPPGAVVVVSPGDNPMRGVTCWPSEELRVSALFCHIDPDGLGLPKPSPETYQWICAIATDDYYHDAVTRQFQETDRTFWSKPMAALVFLNSWPWLLLRPHIRERYLVLNDIDRERNLAETAVQHAGLPVEKRDVTLARMREYYDKKYSEAGRRYGRD